MTAIQPHLTLEDRCAALLTERQAIQRDLDENLLTLLGRVPFLPGAVAETSAACLEPVLDHLHHTRTKGAPIVVFGGAMMVSGHVVAAFLAGGAVIVLQLLQNVADGMAPGLRALGERLATPPERPRPEDDDSG